MTSKCIRWTAEEIDILSTYHPDGGSLAVKKFLPHRSREAILSKAAKVGIKCNKWISREEYNSVKPTPNEYQILLGSLLGDGHITKLPYCCFKLKHGLKQEEYLRWKTEILSRLRTKIFMTNRDTAIGMQTSSYNFLKDLRKEWYPNGKRIAPESVLDLEPLGLAIWFMDDGNCFKDSKRSRRVSISVPGFDYYSRGRLIDMLKINFDIDVILNSGLELCFRGENRGKIFETIRPYVSQISCMRYKLGD